MYFTRVLGSSSFFHLSLSTIDTLEFDNVVGALLFEELRKKSSLETSLPEDLVVRGRSKEKGEKSR